MRIGWVWLCSVFQVQVHNLHPKSTIKKTNNSKTTKTKPGAVNRHKARTSRTHDLTDPRDSPWLVSDPTSCLWGKLWNLQLASGEFRSPETRTWISFSPKKVGSGPQFRVNLPNLTCFPLLCVLPVFSSYSVLTPCRCWQVKLHLLVSVEFWVMESPSSIALSHLLDTGQAQMNINLQLSLFLGTPNT